ncbi:hypothetical protein F0562_030134 [Nyssa sinensis]|uniref:Rab-GAP TBC domain-containing protein n=1 Tax=Nyssa sinensis TaxID=561372 RepID=A0A5J5B1Z6_9ASTE|nr:hypothetical protein F0562_030134 [Nyssa sinensis]
MEGCFGNATSMSRASIFRGTFINQRTLSSLELPRAVSVANGLSSSVLVTDSSSHGSQERTDGSTLDGCPGNIQQNGRQRQKFHDPSRDLSIQVLEKFSLVTKFARETTSQLFRESHGDGFGANQGRNHSQSSHDYPRNMASNDEQKVPDEIPVASDPPEDCLMQTSILVKQKIPCTKLNHDEEAATNVGTFEVDKLTQVWGKPRQPPLGSDEWAAFFDSEGRIMDSEALRRRIFYGGVEHRLRKEYETIKLQWQSISPEQARRFTKFREWKGLIDKDVVRTDRSLSFYDGDDNPNVDLLHDILLTYSFYNFDLGYCQFLSSGHFVWPELENAWN